MSNPKVSQFEEETTSSQTDRKTWVGLVSSQWNINDNPNGGYALSMLLRALQTEASSHPDPVSVSSHFLRPCLGDRSAEIALEVVRQGRRTSTVRGELRQDGKARIIALATLADFDQWGGGNGGVDDPQPLIEIPPPPMVSPHDCPIREGSTQGVSLPLMSRVDVRIDPTCSTEGGVGNAVMQGWIRLADGSPTTADCLPLFADCFPPSMFSLVGQIGWVPTVELTVHVRRRPSPGWIQARFETTDHSHGLLIEDGVLWDDTGHVVAQSRQLALVLDTA